MREIFQGFVDFGCGNLRVEFDVKPLPVFLECVSGTGGIAAAKRARRGGN